MKSFCRSPGYVLNHEALRMERVNTLLKENVTRDHCKPSDCFNVKRWQVRPLVKRESEGGISIFLNPKGSYMKAQEDQHTLP